MLTSAGSTALRSDYRDDSRVVIFDVEIVDETVLSLATEFLCAGRTSQHDVGVPLPEWSEVNPVICDTSCETSR